MKLNKLIFAAAALLVLGCGKKGTEDVLVPEKGSYTGTVTVVYQGSDFDNENIKVDFIPSADGKTADIVLNQIRFVPNMPVQIDVTVPGVTLQPGEKDIVLTCAEVVPKALGGDYPRYTVTNLTGKIVGNEMTFSLKFGDSPTSFRGTK